jgi:hypothetical protein
MISLRRTSIDSTPAAPADLHRGAQEAQLDPAPCFRARAPGRELVKLIHVLARGEAALLGQPPTRQGVEGDVIAIDPDLDSIEVAQLAQLGAGERHLRGTAPAEHDDLLDPALAQRLEGVVGHVCAL